MPNRFNQLLGSQRYVSTAVELPFNDILQIGALKQQAQDKAVAERMDLLGKSWNRLPGDAPRSVELQNKINSTLATMADKDFNDPRVKSDWYKTKMELAKEFSPNGEIGAQQANYDAYKAYEKELLSKSKELGWSSNQLQQHLNEAKNTFKTKGESGDLTYFQGKGLADRVDTSKWLADNLKNVADETGITQLKKYGSLNEVTDAFVSGEINHLDYNKIVNSLAKLAKGDDKLKASLEQEGAFQGKQGGSNFIKGLDKQGNVILDTSNPFGLQLSGLAEGVQYQKLKQDYIKAVDPLELYRAKKAIDEQDLQRQIQWTIQGIPTDPNNPTNNDAGVNLALEASNNPLVPHWELKDGKLTMKDFTDIQETIKIGDKTYNPIKDALPAGYSYAGPGKVMDTSGKIIKTNVKDNKQDEQFNAFQELATIANRLGVKGNREQVQQGVEDYLTNANNFQMNFPRFDEGTKDAISKAFGVTTKQDKNGEMVISNPGQLSFSTLKGLSGQPIEGKDLTTKKARILSGAKILGSAQSLINSNLKPGDMYVQSTDGEVYIINANNKSINDRLAPSTRLVQSIDKYVNSGERTMDKEDASKLDNLFPGSKFTGAEQDSKGNTYYSFIKDNKPGVMILDKSGSPQFLELDEASKILAQDHMVDILPSYNTKNFDKATKATEFDTED